jgi:hypothetical protein
VRIAAPDTPLTITLATAMVLIVTDGLQQGDEFELFDFGASIGSTSANTNNVFHNCGDNAGNHSLTGIVTDSPHGSGDAFFIIQQVPEPGTLALLGIALAASLTPPQARLTNPALRARIARGPKPPQKE